MWATLNEPKYYDYCSYAAGNYPPNEQNFQKFCRVGYHLLLGSAKAVQEFHKGNYIGKIGLVHATGNVETEGDDEANKLHIGMRIFFITIGSQIRLSRGIFLRI